MEITLEKHQAILEESIAAFGGHVFKTIGDALIRSTALQIELKPKSLILVVAT
jgi:class 3 adenylate cyclase